MLLSILPDHSTENSNSSEGTLRQILQSAKQNHLKILSTLPLPIIDARYEANPFSSDHAAWMQTLSSPFSKDTISVPIGDIRWGSCATAGALNNYRVNRDGFGTVIDPIHGSLVWISTSNGKVEAVHLEPGTRM